MKGLHRRLNRLEKESPHAFKPWLMLETDDDQTYTDRASGQCYTRLDLDRLKAEGWRLIILQYEQAQAAQE